MPVDPNFTEAEIQAYLSLLQLPEQYRNYSQIPKDYEFLRVLHVHQIATIPYENLSIHYNPSHTITVDPRLAYEKFISGRGRGGYCMEVAIFYKYLLRALGFEVYFTGVRIRARVDGVPKGDFIGLVHIVNIVTLDNGEQYVVDVAFGGDGPTHPMKLTENNVTTNLGTQQIRFTRSSIPQFELDSFNWWIYQYRNSETQEWQSFYCFAEVPFLYEDYNIMSYWTSGASHQTWTVLIVKFLKDDNESKIVGKVMLVNDTVKRNDGGRTRLEATLKSEGERIDALKSVFGIGLTEEEKGAIKGRVTEILGKEVLDA